MKEVKRGARTESLSLRIDPKTKFVLEFMVRVTGHRITDLIERAIRDYADKTTVGDGFDAGKNWLHYWHPEEGVRMMNMFFDSNVQTSFEEDEIKDFIEQHKEFFYTSADSSKPPITAFVQVLWPNISTYIEHWRETKTHNRWATGTKMLAAIKAADMMGPTWPRNAAPARPPARKPNSDMDDDIPF